jgi:hypothetical protein
MNSQYLNSNPKRRTNNSPNPIIVLEYQLLWLSFSRQSYIESNSGQNWFRHLFEFEYLSNRLKYPESTRISKLDGEI